MILYSLVLGICVGSFVFTLYERFVSKKSLFAAHSFCFHCGKRLKFYHLVPIFSYLFLHAKCAFCGGKISPLSPICELISGMLFVFAYLFSTNTLEFAFLSLYLTTLLLLSLIDIKLKAVPEVLLWLNFIFAFCFAFDESEIYTLLLGNFNDAFVLNALIFAGGMFLLKSLISCLINIKKQSEKLESMGEADILLIASMGGILGFKFGFYVLFVASLLTLFCFFFVKKGFEMPFIPFLSLAFVGIFGLRGYL